jgi:lipoyl(octanoyl) transferase
MSGPAGEQAERRAAPEPQRPRTVRVHRLGRVEYGDGLRLMEGFARAAREGVLHDDVLLLLEHPPVVTLGRGADDANLVFPRPALQARGVEVHETNRGGDVTFHGPGQLVAYPIFNLNPDWRDVHRYVGALEQAVIRTAAEFGVQANPVPGWRGVFVGHKGEPGVRKLAAVGVHLSHWISTHGLALNVNTDLSAFDLIVPCGISKAEAGVTSLARELGRPVPMRDVESALARHFAELFSATLRERRPDRRTVSVSVLREGSKGPEALLLYRHPHRGGFWQPVTGTVERGETPLQTARRELDEETGIPGLVPVDLGYKHAFAFEGRGRPMPRVFEETAFAAQASGDPAVRLDPSEHEKHQWLPVDEAVELVPHLGLKKGLRLAREKLFPAR